MEARIEVLERGFEALLAMRETMEKNFEQERLETRRQLTELVESMRRMNHNDSGGVRHQDEHSDAENESVNRNHPRRREERWRKLEIPVFDGSDAYGDG